MRWSWRLVTLFGIDIKIHATFLLALLWGGFLWSNGGITGALYGVFLTLVLFAIVVMHELGHSLAARRYGISVHDIVLLPIGGVARLDSMPQKPSQELVVALAGPAVNLALIVLTAPAVLGGMALQRLHGQSLAFPVLTAPGTLNFIAFLLMMNVSLFLFNMLPAFPMDGGRALRALLAMKLSMRRATRLAVVVGRLFAVLFGVAGIMTGNISLVVVGVFVFFGAGSEGQDAAASEHSSTPLEPHAPVLLADTPAHQAFDRLMRSSYPALVVVDEGGAYMGMVTRSGMERNWAAGVRGPVSKFIER